MARIRIEDLPVAEVLTAEQEELIQAAGLRSFRPRVEGLEDRQMLDAGLGRSVMVPLAPGAPAPVQAQEVAAPMQVHLGPRAGRPSGGFEQGPLRSATYDVAKDANEIGRYGYDRFVRAVDDKGWLWDVKGGVDWDVTKVDQNTIRLGIEFKYLHEGQLKQGRMEINFVDQGFRAGWFRSYQESGIGLYRYDGPGGADFGDLIRRQFQRDDYLGGGLDVRRPTLDVPSYVAEQARVKFQKDLVDWQWGEKKIWGSPSNVCRASRGSPTASGISR
jgi:hypothetical protein